MFIKGILRGVYKGLIYPVFKGVVRDQEDEALAVATEADERGLLLGMVVDELAAEQLIARERLLVLSRAYRYIDLGELPASPERIKAINEINLAIVMLEKGEHLNDEWDITGNRTFI